MYLGVNMYKSFLIITGISTFSCLEVAAQEDRTVIISDALEERIYAPTGSNNYRFLVAKNEYVAQGTDLVVYWQEQERAALKSPISGLVTWTKAGQGEAYNFKEGTLLAKILSKHNSGMIELNGARYGEHFKNIALCLSSERFRTSWLGSYQGWGLFKLKDDLPFKFDKQSLYAVFDTQSCNKNL